MMRSFKLQIWRLLRGRGSLTFRRTTVWIHSETRTWHNNNIQSNTQYRKVLTKQLNRVAKLAKWVSVRLRTKWLWVRITLPSHWFMLDHYSSSYERILEKSGKFSIDAKRKHKLCIEIYKTLSNLNPSFMKEIFELRLCSRHVREQYKLNLNTPRKRQVTFGTKILKRLGSKIWNNLPYHIKSAENLNVFKNLIKKWNGSPCSCNVCALQIFKYNIIPQMIFVLFL